MPATSQYCLSFYWRQISSANRLEKAFIGSHSDIGGGFGTGDLSDVALMWMVEQEKGQGIAIDNDTLKSQGWNTITNPILHDRSGNSFHADDITITRYVGYENGQQILQTDTVFDGKRTSDTTDLINFFPDAWKCGTIANPDIGLVDMNKYKLWLGSYSISLLLGWLHVMHHWRHRCTHHPQPDGATCPVLI